LSRKNKIRTSPRTGKPVRAYKYKISKSELKRVNKAKSVAQKRILTPSKIKERAKRQQDIYYSDPDKQKRRSEMRKLEWTDPKIRKRRTTALRKTVRTASHRKYLSEIQKKIWKIGGLVRRKKFKKSINEHYKSCDVHADTVSKILNKRSMSRIEIQLESFLQLLGLPYEFVGNGKLMIGRYCPDFKRDDYRALIELGGFRHKAYQKTKKLRDRVEKRTEYIKSQGYQTLVIDEDELQDLESLAVKLLIFDKRIQKSERLKETNTVIRRAPRKRMKV